MYPPVFATAVASVDVLALLGSNPTRLYLFGQATQNTPRPYAVWQMVTGTPGNHLQGLPQYDRYTTQIDVYADTAQAARDAAEVLRDAFEPVAYVTSWRGESRDQATQRYRYSFDVEWHVQRPASSA